MVLWKWSCIEFCNKGPCEEISVEDVKKELERIEYYIQENDIVLIRTDTDKSGVSQIIFMKLLACQEKQQNF